jgi:hypothetical protein
MDELVARLSSRLHNVQAEVLPNSPQGLKESLDRGYVHIKFTETRGGTELGVSVDASASDLTAANFESASGRAHIVGGLTLNYEKVRCIADIDVATLQGQGRLEPLPE